MKQFLLPLACLLMVTIGCGRSDLSDNGDSTAISNTQADLAKAEAEKAVAEAKAAQAKAEAEAAKARADAEIAKAKAEAKAEAAEAEANDPVKQLELLAARLKNRKLTYVRQKDPNHRDEQIAGKWAKLDLFVAELSYDVKKTESLVNPLLGVIKVRHGWHKLKLNGLDEVNTEAEARQMSGDEVRAADNEETAYYVWDNSKWNFRSLEWYDFKSEIPHRFPFCPVETVGDRKKNSFGDTEIVVEAQ